MKDAGCDPIGPDTDQEYEDCETEAGMTAALFVARHTVIYAMQRSAAQLTAQHSGAVQSITPTPHLLLSCYFYTSVVACKRACVLVASHLLIPRTA